MDDDGGDWLADSSEPAKEATPPPSLVEKKKSKKKGKKEEPKEEPKPEPPKVEAPPEELDEHEYLDPDKLLLCKHWIRPKFLQYKYLFDYRHNYYDDVIDFLDKRQRGLLREIPRPQTWAERALRSYNANRCDFYKSLDEDKKLAVKMRLTGAFYHYHTREYFNRKYSSIM